MAQRKNGDPLHLGPQVRKEEGAVLLRSLGAEHVVVTSKWTFDHYYYDSIDHYYYDGQNDADDHHYHGDDDRDKDGIWIENILTFHHAGLGGKRSWRSFFFIYK